MRRKCCICAPLLLLRLIKGCLSSLTSAPTFQLARPPALLLESRINSAFWGGGENLGFFFIIAIDVVVPLCLGRISSHNEGTQEVKVEESVVEELRGLDDMEGNKEKEEGVEVVRKVVEGVVKVQEEAKEKR